MLFLLQQRLRRRLFGLPIALLRPLLFARFICHRQRSQTSPTELYPYIKFYNSAERRAFRRMVGHQGLEPRTDRL